MQHTATAWSNRAIRTGFFLLFGIVPLLLTPINYELFEYNKMMAVYLITALITSAWLIKAIAQKHVSIARTPLDIPITFFFLSQLVSAVFSIDPHVSWFGYYSRFNGGMWSVLSYLILYYAFVSNADAFTKQEPDKKTQNPTYAPLFLTMSVTAGAVAVYAVLERLGIDKHLWVQDVQNRVFSTLGQPNWLAAYLVALIPFTWAQALGKVIHETKKQRISFVVWTGVSFLLFIATLFTRSRSGLAALVLADIIFWLPYIAPILKTTLLRKKTISHPATPAPVIRYAIGTHVILLFFVALFGTGSSALDQWVTLSGIQTKLTKPHTISQSDTTTQAAPATQGPALETGGTESGTIRAYVWQGALNAWNSTWKTRLIGTGTETFAFAFYQFRPVGHNTTSEWDFLYNKSHNEYLNYLATTGAFGLGSYLLFIGAFCMWFVRAHRELFMIRTKHAGTSTLHESAHMTDLALFAGWISLLVTNFFGFSVVVIQLFFFLIPALLFTKTHITNNRTIRLSLPLWTAWIVVAGGILCIGCVASFWYADTLYAKGYRLVRAGLVGQAVPPLIAATRINPAEPVYHDELASAYATLSVASFEGQNATDAATFATRAINESDLATTTSPHNVNFLKTRTKVLYTLSSFDALMNNRAIETLKDAINLSPNDPKIFYNLAILEGREGNNDQAIAYLKKAKALKHDYRDAYFGLWVFYTETKQEDAARAILTEYLDTVNTQDKDFRERLGLEP